MPQSSEPKPTPTPGGPDLHRGADRPGEFEKFRKAVDTPLLANMTEFGKVRSDYRRSAARCGLQRRHLSGDHAADRNGCRRVGLT